MQVTREDLNPCTVKLTVVCDPENVHEGFTKAYKQISKRLRIPGFRPGHAPKAVVDPLISPEELNDTAADIIVRSTFIKAIEQEGLKPDNSTRPSVSLTMLSQEEKKAEYEVKVPLPPSVTLGQYKGLSLTKEPIEITDEEIQQQIDEFRKRRQTRETITDRGVEPGDVAVVNIKVEGETGDGKNFMIIAGQTFAQLDEAISGMRLEEMKQLSLDFPENFQEKNWAGTSKNVTISINSLSAVTLPPLDDEFAKTMQTETVEELTTRVRTGLTAVKENMAREMAYEALLTQLQEASTVNVSDNMWESLAQRRLHETAQEQARAGKTMEQYAAENGMTIESLEQAWNAQAKLQVERALLIRDIFTREKMQLSNKELNQELMLMSQELGMEPETLVNMMRENNSLEELQFRAISRKVGDFLIAHASVEGEESAASTVEVAPEEVPAVPSKSEEAEATAEPKGEVSESDATPDEVTPAE